MEHGYFFNQTLNFVLTIGKRPYPESICPLVEYKGRPCIPNWTLC